MILLDTHIWVNWIVKGDDGLTPSILEAMHREDRLAVSSISCFEVSLLAKRGKIELPMPVYDWLYEALKKSGVNPLPVTCDIAHRAVMLPDIHRDPADRIIIATALVYDIKLASMDSVFPNYQEIELHLIGN
ncbi:MAG: type II toxin-antitoxin system VapC family toxin [Desulfonatronovibrio sp. MSAO_Bac4]|nr:MAG: type II toxin-antitoxin system VapC family toxin [Desulfonatronovibrio sp. MSAO_Bac4]